MKIGGGDFEMLLDSRIRFDVHSKISGRSVRRRSVRYCTDPLIAVEEMAISVGPLSPSVTLLAEKSVQPLCLPMADSSCPKQLPRAVTQLRCKTPPHYPVGIHDVQDGITGNEHVEGAPDARPSNVAPSHSSFSQPYSGLRRV